MERTINSNLIGYWYVCIDYTIIDDILILCVYKQVYTDIYLYTLLLLGESIILIAYCLPTDCLLIASDHATGRARAHAPPHVRGPRGRGGA